jgi:CRISPR/Cas system-associated endonuclease Cas1
MNLGHTVIHRRARIALEAAGLCDAIGLVHEPRPGHPALGSDLQEPFRHLVDRWILSVIHLVEDSDFSRREDGTVVLDASARLRLLAELHRQWHRAMRLSIAQDPVSYQILLERQARALATWLAEPSRGFRAFRQPTRALNA